jgi:hypothetical protein
VWRFSERFMEDCIHASPTAFLGEKVEVSARQKRIGKFIPDLILKNENGTILIVEIQQKALDRYHLYKSLEYRDLVLGENDTPDVRIILFCETLDDRFRQLLKTNKIELIEMDREQFISIAVRQTPSIVTKHLLSETEEPGSGQGSDSIKLEFRPLTWGLRSSPTDILAHLHGEFGRLGIDVDKLPRRYYSQIYWDICNLLDDDAKHALGKIWLPDAWNYERLLTDSKESFAREAQKTLKKPRISISPHVTKKGNLSLVWWPTDYDRAECDWNWWPGDGTLGWNRPNNELFFVREVDRLNPGLYFSQWDDRVNYDVLDGIFIGLLKASIDHFVSVCRIFFDVELYNDIEVDLSGPEPVPGNMFPDRCIVGWRIYNLEERKRRNEDEWLANFDKEYGFTIDHFSECYRIASVVDSKSTPNAVRKVTSELKKCGHRISEGGVRAIVDRINVHHDRNVRVKLK